jgi:hypothetical protein
MAEHNYKINFKTDPKLYMCVETFMPFYKANIDLSVLIDPQHDGHLWPKEFVDGEEHQLAEEILGKLRPHVMAMIQKAKPYSIHGPT